ncbi:MAG: M23 family metallopeptidase [Firmicutes bacterium]|nr:M23 family metallopeptidase [Bacillota bacterium]
MKTNNKNNDPNTTPFAKFIKKYGYYFVLVLSVGVLALVVTLATLDDGNLNVGPDIEVDVRPVSFAMPVTSVTLGKGYSGTELQYNNTLKQWEAHKAVQFMGEAGTEVFAVYDATVKEVYNNYLMGNVVVLEMKNGVSVLYASLGSDVAVTVGQTVKTGQKIGTMSDSAKGESGYGPHLRLEMYKNGVKIDPGLYLDLAGK